MPIQTACPGCKITLALPDDALGKSVRCPKCNIIFAVAAQAAKAPQAAAPSPPVAPVPQQTPIPQPAPPSVVSAPPPAPAPLAPAASAPSPANLEIQSSVQEGTKVNVPPESEAFPEKSGKPGAKPPGIPKKDPDEKPKTRRRYNDPSPPSMIGIAMIAGALVVVLGVCVACGIGGWYFWPSGRKGNEGQIADGAGKNKPGGDGEVIIDDQGKEIIDNAKTKEHPPQVDRGERLTWRASLDKVLGEIKPPPLEADRVERDLPDSINNVVVGRGGRYLLLHMNRLSQVAVFDVNEAKIVKIIPVGDRGKVAAGRDHMLIVYPDDRKMERWSLVDFTKEATGDSPTVGKLVNIAMGSGSRGPLYVGCSESTTLVNVDRMKPLEILEKFRLFPRDPYYLRASLDGTAFAMRPGIGGEPHEICLITLDGFQVSRKIKSINSSVVTPSKGGKSLFTGYGVFSSELEPIHPVPQASQNTRPFVPAVHGPFFMQYEGKGGDDLGGNIDFFLADRYASPFASQKGIEGVSGELIAYGQNRDTLNHDQRVFLIPRANLLVSIPKSNYKLILRRFDLAEALKKSGLDFLAVTSEPNGEAKKGTVYRYQVTTLSSRANPTFGFQTGPEGMTVDPNGLVTWTVPQKFAEQHARVTMIISGGPREVSHTFTIDVND